MLNIRTKLVESSRLVIGPYRFPLTDPQRYALLQVRGGRAASELRAHMDEMSWPYPVDADFVALIDAGMIRYDARLISLGYPYALLPKGLTAATAVTNDLCQKLNVHLLETLSGSRGLAPCGVCSCGTWRHSTSNNSSAYSRIGNAFAAHLVDPTGARGKAAMERALAAIDAGMGETRQ